MAASLRTARAMYKEFQSGIHETLSFKRKKNENKNKNKNLKILKMCSQVSPINKTEIPSDL